MPVINTNNIMTGCIFLNQDESIIFYYHNTFLQLTGIRDVKVSVWVQDWVWVTFQCQFLSTQLFFMLLITRKIFCRWTKTLCREWINYIIGYFLGVGETIGGSVLCCGYCSVSLVFCFNPLSPNIHIQILQTDLYTFS